jgi:hypothetical protein
MDTAGHPVDNPITPPPPPHDEAHEIVIDRVFPQLSTDQPMIIQMPTYRDLPKPNLRATETAQED